MLVRPSNISNNSTHTLDGSTGSSSTNSSDRTGSTSSDVRKCSSSSLTSILSESSTGLTPTSSTGTLTYAQVRPRHRPGPVLCQYSPGKVEYNWI